MKQNIYATIVDTLLDKIPKNSDTIIHELVTYRSYSSIEIKFMYLELFNRVVGDAYSNFLSYSDISSDEFECYIGNCAAAGEYVRCLSEYIDEAFSWSSSDEGFSFWSNISSTLRSSEEKLYEEISKGTVYEGNIDTTSDITELYKKAFRDAFTSELLTDFLQHSERTMNDIDMYIDESIRAESHKHFMILCGLLSEAFRWEFCSPGFSTWNSIHTNLANAERDLRLQLQIQS